jgi:hypothetical protein
MTVPDASRQRWLPALVLPLLAAVTVVALGSLADSGEGARGLEQIRAALPPIPAAVSSPALPSPASPPASAVPTPLARADAPLPQTQQPQLRKGFSPVLERIEPAHRPLGDALDPNAPISEAPSGTEVEIPPGTGPASLE